MANPGTDTNGILVNFKLCILVSETMLVGDYFLAKSIWRDVFTNISKMSESVIKRQ